MICSLEVEKGWAEKGESIKKQTGKYIPIRRRMQIRSRKYKLMCYTIKAKESNSISHFH